ncbi:MAG: hypothetical protein PWP14_205 [Methanolobus sp.]|nr:hypothetical protein [Methanolobus sp.]MDK2833418.1 hypothetical protein [Methanolobus sp.]MDN5308811.1 hypothetical protein [Methanolobus sp.]
MSSCIKGMEDIKDVGDTITERRSIRVQRKEIRSAQRDWLGSRYPGIDILSHNAGHLWYTLLGFEGEPHLSLFHIVSSVFILGGLYLLASAWGVLYKAQQNKTLATKGLYAYVRHPQYDAFILVMIGFLIQWSTILTLLMFPVLVWSYFLLAKREEKMFWQTLAKNIPVIWQKPLHSYRI